MFFKFPAEVEGGMLFQTTGAPRRGTAARFAVRFAAGRPQLDKRIGAPAVLRTLWTCTSTVAAVFVERGRSKRHG